MISMTCLGRQVEGLDLLRRVDPLMAELGQQLRDMPQHLSVIDHAEPGERRLVCKEDILVDGQGGDQGQILIDMENAFAVGLRIVAQCDLPAVHEDRARIGTQVSTDCLQQRRFPGAVLAHQADDLSLLEGEADGGKGPDAAEALGDVKHFQER
jgi:hypothetical protein